MSLLPDIFFTKEWGEYYATKEQDGNFQIFEVHHPLGQVFYPFIKRRIPIEIEGQSYYDTITPYGFSGPIIIECKDGKRSELSAIFNVQFQNYCEEQCIVSEYIRFSPWLHNYQDFQESYCVKNQGHTMFIDLSVDNFFLDEFSPKARTQVRKAQNNGIEIEFDFIGSTAHEFHTLYEAMANKLEFSDYYRFSDEFLRNSFNLLEGKQFFLNARYEGKCISSSFLLYHGDYLHYHLTANNPDFFHLAANSLIIYEACRWGVENGFKELHLGGSSIEALYKFKKRFTKTQPLELIVGKKIRIQEIYDKLTEIKKQNADIENSNFFPLYRG